MCGWSLHVSMQTSDFCHRILGKQNANKNPTKIEKASLCFLKLSAHIVNVAGTSFSPNIALESRIATKGTSTMVFCCCCLNHIKKKSQ